MNSHLWKQTLALFVIFFMSAAPLFAAEMTTKEKASRIPSIMVRGAFDALTTPLEFIYTPKAEKKQYPRLWPLTSMTSTATHVFYRLSSAIYDIAFYPFAAPFVDETPPLTEKMGLSPDVWEMENEY